MLNWMEKNRKYLIVVVWVSTISFVGAGFIGWGNYSFDFFRNNAVATVGDIKITPAEYQIAYVGVKQYYDDAYGKELTQEQLEQLGIQNVTIDTLIERALLLNYAKDIGMIVLDSEVQNALINTSDFQKDGVFDKDTYYQVLKNVMLSPNDYEDNLRKSILSQKLLSAFSLPATPLEIKAFGSSNYLTDTVRIDILKKPTSVDVNEEKLKDFWNKNSQKYMTPTTYVINAVIENPQKVDVNDSYAKAFWQNNKNQYQDNNGTILSFDEAKKQVYEDAKLEIARKKSLRDYVDIKQGKIEPKDSIDITQNDIKTLDEQSQESFKDIKEAEVIKPTLYNNSYMTGVVEKVIEPRAKNFQEARNEAKKDYEANKINEVFAKTIKDKLKNPIEGEEITIVKNDIKLIEAFDNIDDNIKFIQDIFKQNKKKGYIEVSDKIVVLYDITHQNIIDYNKFQQNYTDLKTSEERLKLNEIRRGLASFLRDKYEINVYLDQSNKG